LSGIESLHVTAMAEQVPIQRETAATFLITQLHPAVLGKKAPSSSQSSTLDTEDTLSVCPAQYHTPKDWKKGLPGPRW
jgi:hypothetical protein